MQDEKKKLGLFNLFRLGVGGAIGFGIFAIMGFGIAYAGRSPVLAVSVGCWYLLLASLFHPIMSSMFVGYDMKSMLMGPTMTGFSALAPIVNGLGMASYGLAFSGSFPSLFTGLADRRRGLRPGVLPSVFTLLKI